MDAGRCCCLSMNASNDSFIFVPIRRVPLQDRQGTVLFMTRRIFDRLVAW